MQRQILAGEALEHRRHDLALDLADLDEAMRARVIAIVNSIALDRLPEKAVVLDSGVDPELRFGDEDDLAFLLKSMEAPIEEAIGPWPEVEEPTDDVGEVVSAWEAWLELYQANALGLFTEWNNDPPGQLAGGRFNDLRRWDSVRLSLGHGVVVELPIEAGAKARRDALAARLREQYTRRMFDSESVNAAIEATLPGPVELRTRVDESTPEELAACHLRRVREQYRLAQAHHLSRRRSAPDFETEMRDWAREHGSKRLSMGLEDGYRMNARYLAERIGREAPGFFALPAKAAANKWAVIATSPSEEALVLRRKVRAAVDRHAPLTPRGRADVKIVRLNQPPHEMYEADSAGYPVAGWTWSGEFEPEWAEPQPFDAVVVFNWLGRFHLVGAVRNRIGQPPPGVWAAPDPEDFGDDGSVLAADPDAPEPNRAKKKPPGKPVDDDDIPF